MNEIKDLKKGDKFQFNDTIYIVKRKWVNDDKPLIAVVDVHYYKEERFDYEGLQITKV